MNKAPRLKKPKLPGAELSEVYKGGGTQHPSPSLLAWQKNKGRLRIDNIYFSKGFLILHFKVDNFAGLWYYAKKIGGLYVKKAPGSPYRLAE